MSSNTEIAIAGIAAAGIVGPGLGYIAGWRSDVRRFKHERALKASDDLIARIDEVSAALETLSERAVALRTEVILSGATKSDDLLKAVRAADDAYQAARVSIARLEIRAHADPSLCDAAKTAAKAYAAPAKAARDVLVKQLIEGDLATGIEQLGEIPEMIDRAYKATRAYQVEARRTLDSILGSERDRSSKS